MGVIAEKPVTRAELEERLAIAKTYGPQAVMNLAAEFRRRSGPDPAMLHSLQKSLATEMALPQNFFTPHPDPSEVRHAHEGLRITEQAPDISGGTTSSPITEELLITEQVNTDENYPVNKPPDFNIGGVSIPAASSMDFKISMSPVGLAQDVRIAPVAPLSETWRGIVWQTWVSGINELTIRLANVTDKAIKPAKQEFFHLAGVSGVPSPNASSKADGSTDLQKCGLEAARSNLWTSAESFLRNPLQKRRQSSQAKKRHDALTKDRSGPPTREERIELLRLTALPGEEEMVEKIIAQNFGAVDKPVAKRLYTPTHAQIAQHDEPLANSVGSQARKPFSREENCSMATTAIALTDQQLDAELQRQRRELSQLREKEQAELRKLDAAKSEHARVFDAIERGVTGKETELSRAKEAVETAEIRTGGVRKVIAQVEAKIHELTEELGRRQLAAAKAAHENAYSQLFEEGGALAAVIVEKLMALTTEELAAFDRIRVRLGTEFLDFNGAAAADQLSALLWRQSGPNEKLRDPNIHNRLLEDRGWIFAGKVQRIPSAMSQFGNPMVLTIQSMMRPRQRNFSGVKFFSEENADGLQVSRCNGYRAPQRARAHVPVSRGTNRAQSGEREARRKGG